MRSKLLIAFALVTLFSLESEAQVILKNGEYFGFAGNYEYTDDAKGLYEVFIWGSEGEFEAEIKYKGLIQSYKLACTVKYEEGGSGHVVSLYYDKLLSGSCLQKSEFETAKSKKYDTRLLTFVMSNRSTNKNELVTTFGKLDILNHESGTARNNIFLQLESEGDEGPP